MRALTTALAALVLSCGHRAPPVADLHGALGGEAVARVGEVPIPSSLVGSVAGAEGISTRDALARLIEDALASQGARASGDDRSPSTRWMLETIVGRTVIDRAGRDARAAGPPTDDELEKITRIHWLEADLPEQAKVVHAVVLAPKDPAQNDAARALAARIEAAVAGAKDADDFIARAKAVPPGDLTVVVESLPLFVEDGRFADGTQSFMNLAFAKAAFALKKPGETSGITPTVFGWHVIRLIERLPPKVLSAEVRRARYADEVVTHRAQVALGAVFDARRRSTRVAILPDAEARMVAVSSREAP